MSRGKQGIGVILVALLLMSLAPGARGEDFAYNEVKAVIPFEAEGSFTLTEGDFTLEEGGETYAFVEKENAETYTCQIPDEDGNKSLELVFDEPGNFTYKLTSEDVLNDTAYMIVVSVENNEDDAEDPDALKVSTAIWRLDTKAKVENIRNYFGDLRIVKTLDVLESSEVATFVFQIEGTKGEGEKKQLVYSNVAVITLNGTSVSGEALLTHIPAGTELTVTEVYSGAHYRLAGEATQTGIVIANQTPEEALALSFVNTYDPIGRGGHGLDNAFTPEKQSDDSFEWSWTQPELNN